MKMNEESRGDRSRAVLESWANVQRQFEEATGMTPNDERVVEFWPAVQLWGEALAGLRHHESGRLIDDRIDEAIVEAVVARESRSRVE